MHQQPYSGVTRVGDTRGGDWGCHPSIFSRKTWQPFFQSPVLRCHPWFLLRKNWRPFLLIALSLFIAFTRVSPPRGCHPTPFSPVRSRFSTILCKFAHKKKFSFGPPGGCHPGRSAPRPLVTTLQPYNNNLVLMQRPSFLSDLAIPSVWDVNKSLNIE